MLFHYHTESERRLFVRTACGGREIIQWREILEGICLTSPGSSLGLRRTGIAKVDIIGVDLRAAALVAFLSWNYADILWNGIQAKAVAAAFEQLSYKEQWFQGFFAPKRV